MKSFWTGAAIAVVIAVVAGVALNVTGQSSAQKFSTTATRKSIEDMPENDTRSARFPRFAEENF
ncbi:MAG TPA: hypothetical protein VIG92_04805, partial [Rhodospirillales bacterium]